MANIYTFYLSTMQVQYVWRNRGVNWYYKCGDYEHFTACSERTPRTRLMANNVQEINTILLTVLFPFEVFSAQLIKTHKKKLTSSCHVTQRYHLLESSFVFFIWIPTLAHPLVIYRKGPAWPHIYASSKENRPSRTSALSGPFAEICARHSRFPDEMKKLNRHVWHSRFLNLSERDGSA